MVVQGDVFFVRVAAIPRDAQKIRRSPRGYIIAHGEKTGHSHLIVQDIELYEVDGVLYVSNSNPEEVIVKHDEHCEVSLDRGIWRVGIQRKFDAFMAEIKMAAIDYVGD